MEAFFVILVVVFMLIRGLSKLGVGKDDEPSRPRQHRKATRPPPSKTEKLHRGATHKPRGATHKSASASSRPGPQKVRRPIFGRRKTPEHVEAPPAQAPGSETYVHYLIDVLRVGEPDASRQAIERLVEMGRPALPALQEAARDDSPFVRERAQQASRRIMKKLALAGQPDGVTSLEGPPIALPPPSSPPAARPGAFDKRPPEPEPKGLTVPEMPELPEAPTVDDLPDMPEVADLPDAPVPSDVSSDPEVASADVAAEEPAPEVPAIDGDEVGQVAAILREAAAEPGFGGRREEILEPLKLVIAHFVVVAARVQWTGSFGVSDVYRGGRTVAGTMQDADLPVAVSLPKDRNAWADALKDGTAFAFRGVFAAWDGMYDRGRFEGDLLEEPVAQED